MASASMGDPGDMVWAVIDRALRAAGLSPGRSGSTGEPGKTGEGGK